jgi:septal ring factor EnvC (AmiA/AmiB activator)
MLNWHRDPDYERRMNALAIRIQQTKHETEQIEKALLRVRKERAQLRRETEQIRQETERLRRQNAKGRQLLASIDALCFPPESSSTPATAIEPVSKPSSP